MKLLVQVLGPGDTLSPPDSKYRTCGASAIVNNAIAARTGGTITSAPIRTRGDISQGRELIKRDVARGAANKDAQTAAAKKLMAQSLMVLSV